MENTLTGVLGSIFDVFSAIANWFAETLPVIMQMFYNTEGLTFLGALAVAGLGISIIFLLIGVISNFLHFRC